MCPGLGTRADAAIDTARWSVQFWKDRARCPGSSRHPQCDAPSLVPHKYTCALCRLDDAIAVGAATFREREQRAGPESEAPHAGAVSEFVWPDRPRRSPHGLTCSGPEGRTGLVSGPRVRRIRRRAAGARIRATIRTSPFDAPTRDTHVRARVGSVGTQGGARVAHRAIGCLRASAVRGRPGLRLPILLARGSVAAAVRCVAGGRRRTATGRCDECGKGDGQESVRSHGWHLSKTQATATDWTTRYLKRLCRPES
jgi:hypothetical protein